MVRRLVVISLTVLIFFNNPAFVSAAESLAAKYTVEDSVQQQILGATLRITMVAMEESATQRVYAVSDGLGTLVQVGDAKYIVTHDHWSVMGPEVTTVRFESAAGDLLMEMSRSGFYDLVRYLDGGTMVLTAPAELPDCVTPVQVMDEEQPLAEGDTLAIVYWQPESDQQVSVEPVTAQTIEKYRGKNSIVMQSQNGRVVEHGNSGGGVFAGAKLVGNMWETITLNNLENGQHSSTDLSRAARYTFVDPVQAEAQADAAVAEGPGHHGEF
jgi:hypothetical protein